MNKAILFLFLLTINHLVQAATIEDKMIKTMMANLIEKCGKNDLECKKIVKTQLVKCHNKSNDEFKSYLSAPIEDEDIKLAMYYNKILKCLKYKNGRVLFEF